MISTDDATVVCRTIPATRGTRWERPAEEKERRLAAGSMER